MPVRVQLPPGALKATSLVAFLFYVLRLYSTKCNRYYIGYSKNFEARLERHNTGMVAATKNCRPYMIKAFKSFPTELEAKKEEHRLKKGKNRKYLGWLIEGNW